MKTIQANTVSKQSSTTKPTEITRASRQASASNNQKASQGADDRKANSGRAGSAGIIQKDSKQATRQAEAEMRTTRSKSANKPGNEVKASEGETVNIGKKQTIRTEAEAPDRKPEISKPLVSKFPLRPSFEPSIPADYRESDSSINHGSSLDVTLNSNPLCEVVEKFTSLRRMHSTGTQKPKLANFIKQFEEAMEAQEQLYQANKIEPQFARNNDADKQVCDFLNPEYLGNEFTLHQDESYSHHPESKSMSVDPHPFMSAAISANPSKDFASKEFSSDEHYRRYHFKQNSLMPFYPKPI